MFFLARSPMAASALTRVAAALLLCTLLWLAVAWALDWIPGPGMPA